MDPFSGIKDVVKFASVIVDDIKSDADAYEIKAIKLNEQIKKEIQNREIEIGVNKVLYSQKFQDREAEKNRIFYADIIVLFNSLNKRCKEIDEVVSYLDSSLKLISDVKIIDEYSNMIEVLEKRIKLNKLALLKLKDATQKLTSIK